MENKTWGKNLKQTGQFCLENGKAQSDGICVECEKDCCNYWEVYITPACLQAWAKREGGTLTIGDINKI